MERLIESRGQYDELKYKVGEELRTIQNVRDLLGEDCIKEEYNKYIKALHALKRVFVFSVEEKEEAFDEVLNDIKDEETKDLARKYVETWKEERRKELEAEQFRKLLENQTASMTDEQILKYPDFVEKWQSGKEYVVGKRLEYNGTIYKVLQAHTSQDTWTPPDAPSLFAKVLIPDSSTVPEWEQPDSTNPYAKGDKVTHNGKTWISTADGNVWEPGVYGWEEV